MNKDKDYRFLKELHTKLVDVSRMVMPLPKWYIAQLAKTTQELEVAEAIEERKQSRQRVEKRRRKLTDGVMNKLYGGE